MKKDINGKTNMENLFRRLRCSEIMYDTFGEELLDVILYFFIVFMIRASVYLLSYILYYSLILALYCSLKSGTWEEINEN